MRKNIQKLMIVPMVGLAVGAIALMGGALAGDSGLPDSARSLTSLPKESGNVAPAPEGLSSVTVTRDWQEVATSGSQRRRR